MRRDGNHGLGSFSARLICSSGLARAASTVPKALKPSAPEFEPA